MSISQENKGDLSGFLADLLLSGIHAGKSEHEVRGALCRQWDQWWENKAMDNLPEALPRLTRAILNGVDDIIVVKDRDLRIRYANDAFLKVSGIPQLQQVLGKTDLDIFGSGVNKHEAIGYMEDERQTQKLPKGQILRREEYVTLPDGSRRLLLTRKYPLWDEQNQLLGSANISTDITDIREAERSMLAAKLEAERLNQRLQAEIEKHRVAKAIAQEMGTQSKLSLQEAKAANEAKTRFLTNMSHEIRTPMNAILGFTEMLREQEADSQKISCLENISQAGNNLLSLINDILDLSKVEAGKLAFHYEFFNPTHLLGEIHRIFESRISRKKLSWKASVDPRLPREIYLDEVRLRQILFNVIGNAIKFTESGFVHCELSATNFQERLYPVFDFVVEVRDSGIGIAPGQHEKIFEEFNQVDHGTSRLYEGSGLGLAITKRLCEVMGGAITVESKPGQGSCFRFTFRELRYRKEKIPSFRREIPSPESFQDFTPSTLLIVDDVQSNQNLIRLFLKDSGHQLLFAYDGEEAIRQAEQWHPDLILMDVRMPNMDGLEAARQMANDPTLAEIPIIFLTGRTGYPETEEAALLGKSVLIKPFSRKDLFRELSRFLQKKPSAWAPAPSLGKHHNSPISKIPFQEPNPAWKNPRAWKKEASSLCKVPNIRKIKEFAAKLHHHAQMEKNGSLADLTRDLYEKTELFDVPSVKSLLSDLKDFPDPPQPVTP